MPKAYVGVASPHGLAVLHLERDDTLCLVERWVRTGRRRVGFWVVLGDADADSVQALFRCGYRREALVMLDRCAKALGGSATIVLSADRQWLMQGRIADAEL